MLDYVVNFLNDWTWQITGIIGVITLIMVRHLLQVASLPPGPFPLPIIGNILMFRGKGNDVRCVLDRLQQKYKDMFTIWLGPIPTILVCSWDLCHDALVVKRNDFSGRVWRHSFEQFTGGFSDVVTSDFGPTWETLRKILSTAIRKYAVSEKLAELVSDVVDRNTEAVVKKGGLVDSSTFMSLIIYNVLASSTFGIRFEQDDPEFIRLLKNNDDINEKLGNGLPTDALPFLKIFYKRRIQELADVMSVHRNYIKKNFKEHESTYQSGDIRDFTDALLSAREEAEAEGKESLQYLTEGNMVATLFDLFSAGTDTTRIFLMWIFLIISNKPEVQRKMQEEIDQHIGSRQPVQKDKSSCHYINAVMTEVLRNRPVLDFTIEHKAVYDTELGGYKIPKGTSLVFGIKSAHFNSKYWKDPEEFKPERFLDADGKFANIRFESYMPFSLGRRSCPGEKLALADTFLITTRLLQKHSFQLEGGPGTADLQADIKTFANFPNPYKLVIKPRDVNM